MHNSPITDEALIHPQDDPTSMPGPDAPSTTDPKDKFADLDNAVRIVLTMHGSFEHDFPYIVQYFHQVGHKDVDLAFVSQVWEMYKNSAMYGDGWVRKLAIRWPIEIKAAAEQAATKKDWARANEAKGRGTGEAGNNVEQGSRR